MTTQSDEEELWIGLVSLSSVSPNAALAGARAAYSNLVARAANEAGFREQAHLPANTLDLLLVEVLWAEPLSKRLKTHDLDAHLWRVVRLTQEDGEPRFGAFHTWEEDDLAN